MRLLMQLNNRLTKHTGVLVNKQQLDKQL